MCKNDGKAQMDESQMEVGITVTVMYLATVSWTNVIK